VTSAGDMPAPAEPVVRFGAFDVDRRSGELRKGGVRIRIPEQPFRILTALLDRPGEIVTREELRKTLWPEDTFVDFEPREDGLYAIRYLDLASGRLETVHSFDRPSVDGLGASADGRAIVYSKIEQEKADILLVENFR
jgi:DNA-binding response OmpR family regulator